jgi:hypothetical protein
LESWELLHILEYFKVEKAEINLAMTNLEPLLLILDLILDRNFLAHCSMTHHNNVE